jgi:hypothetical protein
MQFIASTVLSPSPYPLLCRQKPQAWTLQGRKASEDILRAAATAVGPAAVADLQGDPEFEKEVSFRRTYA